MNNPYTKLLSVCDSAEQFIADSKDPNIPEDMLTRILACLISAEEILDKGRSVMQPGASFEFEEDKRKVNERMDAIRSETFDLMQRIGKAKVTEMLDYQARQNRTRAVVNNL